LISLAKQGLVIVVEMNRAKQMEDSNPVRFPRNQHCGALLAGEVCRIRTRPFDPQWQDITTLVRSLIRRGLWPLLSQAHLLRNGTVNAF
jgi:hypothetical protein